MEYEWWALGGLPPNPPDLVGDCQLYVVSRQGVLIPDFASLIYQWVEIRVAKGWYENVFSPQVGSVFLVRDTFTRPWYYLLMRWENVHLGFPNEYTALYCVQCDDQGQVPDSNR